MRYIVDLGHFEGERLALYHFCIWPITFGDCQSSTRIYVLFIHLYNYFVVLVETILAFEFKGDSYHLITYMISLICIYFATI